MKDASEVEIDLVAVSRMDKAHVSERVDSLAVLIELLDFTVFVASHSFLEVFVHMLRVELPFEMLLLVLVSLPVAVSLFVSLPFLSALLLWVRAPFVVNELKELSHLLMALLFVVEFHLE